MSALAVVPACSSRRACDTSRDLCRVPATHTGLTTRVRSTGVNTRCVGGKRGHLVVRPAVAKNEQEGVTTSNPVDVRKDEPGSGSSRRLVSVGLFAPLGSAYDAIGGWLVEHPAPDWMVNSPMKTKATAFLASVFTGGEYDVDESVKTVQALIASDDVVIFSATYCPFSAAAKSALKAEGVPFTAVEWNKTKGGAGFAPALANLYHGRASIPHVFINGNSIGGCNDGTPGIRPLIAAGGLDDALAGCSETTKNARAAFLSARGTA